MKGLIKESLINKTSKKNGVLGMKGVQGTIRITHEKNNRESVCNDLIHQSE